MCTYPHTHIPTHTYVYCHLAAQLLYWSLLFFIRKRSKLLMLFFLLYLINIYIYVCVCVCVCVCVLREREREREKERERERGRGEMGNLIIKKVFIWHNNESHIFCFFLKSLKTESRQGFLLSEAIWIIISFRLSDLCLLVRI